MNHDTTNMVTVDIHQQVTSVARHGLFYFNNSMSMCTLRLYAHNINKKNDNNHRLSINC